jgi:hypothetical protein
MKVSERILGSGRILVVALLAAPASFGVPNQATTKTAQKPPNQGGNTSAPQKPAASAPHPVQQTPPRTPNVTPPQAPVRPPQPGTGGSPNNGKGASAGLPAGKNAGIAGGGEPKPKGITGGNSTGGPAITQIKPKDYSAAPVYKPKGGGTGTPLPGGGFKHSDPKSNTTVTTDPRGRIASIETARTKARDFRPDGRAAHIEHTRADGSRMTVDRGVRGERRVEVVRADGVRVVAIGRHGFVERSVRPGYVSRTYVVGGRVFVCRRQAYGRIVYYRYVPRVYYGAAFYGWAYRPWGVPVVYAWGWGPAPVWFYGGYFAPAPYYSDPTLWLTDYLLAENLKLAYQDGQASGADSGTPPPPPTQNAFALTPETKQMIAEEVRQQIQAEQAAAQQQQIAPGSTNQPEADAPPPALDSNQRAFVVSGNLDVTTVKGDGCSLTAGDILFRTGDLQGDKVQVTVLNSKSGDCLANSVTAVDVAELQDMQNQFREQIAAGMAALASNQDRKGLPTPPAASPVQVPDGHTPAGDAQILLQLNQEADQTEAEIKQAASGGA